MGKKHSKERREKEGRPTVMTETVLQKLEDAFMNAFTDKMACLYAGISETTLYDYCQKYPKYAERKELLKISPDLKAQETLVKDNANVGGARWWAEHKMPEFMPKSKVEHGGRIETNDVTGTEAVREIKKKYEGDLRKVIADKAKKMP